MKATLKKLGVSAIALSIGTTMVVPAYALNDGQTRTLLFAMAAGSGWGLSSAIDLVIGSVGNYNGDAQRWGKAAATVCGSGAATLLYYWKPAATEVTGKNIALAMLKAGGIISSANACKWAVGGLAAGIINAQAAGAANDTAISTWQNPTGDWERWNTSEWRSAWNNLQWALGNASTSFGNFVYWNNEAYKYSCTAGNTSAYCATVMTNRNYSFDNYTFYHQQSEVFSWDLGNMTQNDGEINGQHIPPVTRQRP
jgi:hypothetical protein